MQGNGVLVPDAHRKLLCKLEEGRRALGEARTLYEAKAIRDMAQASAYLLRQQQLSKEAVADAMDLKVWAERRLGKMLAETVHAGNPQFSHHARNGKLPKGVTCSQSSRWQRIASVPEPEFKEYIKKAREKGELTTAGVLRLVTENQREAKRQENRKLIEKGQTIEQARLGTYPTLVIDPPWDFGDEGDVDQFGRGRPTYMTMSFEQIRALPISSLAEPNAHLYLWITNRSYLKGPALLEHWGFRYITCLTWCKPSIGMGYYFRGSTEHVLFAVRGSLKLLKSDVGTWFAAKRAGPHSTKPAKFFELVETCSPGPWLELFARTPRKGWTSWGAEAGHPEERSPDASPEEAM
jgi:N6-adenosine-specific RNA methylase IME4